MNRRQAWRRVAALAAIVVLLASGWSLLVRGAPPALAQATAQADTDGDGLPDEWERNGVTIMDGDQPVFLNLPAMGADPNHKDLFVQVDYMVGDNHTHKPKPEALDILRQAFSGAPVANPDGTTGIRIHIDAGADSVMNPVTGAKWGALSQAQVVAHEYNFTTGSRETRPDWTPFLVLMDKNLSAARKRAFRYCIFAHNLGADFGDTSGWAGGIPSTYCIVTLGSWTNQVGTVDQQAGTLMHELGHTIGLRHGGGDHVHRKPNYLSVMNYLFQTRGLRIDRQDGWFNYSTAALPSLDETNLDKTVGLDAGADFARFGTRFRLKDDTGTRNFWVNNANGAIDWNGNRNFTERSVEADINADGDKTTLTGWNDWPNLVYATGPLGLASGTRTRAVIEEVSNELTHADDETMPDPYEVAVAFSGNVSGAPGSVVSCVATVRNMGDNDDTYRIVVESEQGWADVSGVPSELALASGQEGQVTIPVRIPASGSVTADVIHLEVSSKLEARILDSTEATVTAIVPPAGGGAPTVTGGNGGGGGGCFIATAAYGSYLDPHVVTLRDFRDHQLLTNAPGRAFVALYYRWSPPMARMIARSPLLRGATVLALTPIVYGIEYPWIALLLLALSALLLTRLVQARRMRRLAAS